MNMVHVNEIKMHLSSGQRNRSKGPVAGGLAPRTFKADVEFQLGRLRYVERGFDRMAAASAISFAERRRTILAVTGRRHDWY
jgi:hypothetical protein